MDRDRGRIHSTQGPLRSGRQKRWRQPSQSRASGLGDRVEMISCCYSSVDQDGRGQHSLAWGMEENVGLAKGEEKEDSDTHLCHDSLGMKNLSTLSTPRMSSGK